MNTLQQIKKNVSCALEKLGLHREVSLDEIEKEVLGVETAFQSLLLLGILRRIMYYGNEEAAKLFIPAVTEWKNYLPHNDLGGLSPAEAMEKYPPGPKERFFVSAMMEEYQARLRAGDNSSGGTGDIADDFAKFQNEYLERIPAEYALVSRAGEPPTIREIIKEERRQAGRAQDSLDKIGIKIFAEDVAESLGEKLAALDDRYVSALQEIKLAQRHAIKRNKARVRAIRKQLEKDEPYHRCGPAPHQFYLNYAQTVFLDDDSDKDLVLSLLDRSLALKPDYEYARIMRRRLEDYYSRE